MNEKLTQSSPKKGAATPKVADNMKWIFIALISLFIALALLIALVLVLKRADSSNSDSNSALNDQRTNECSAVGTYLEGSLNISADPCSDFYKFTCGNWPTSHPPPITWNTKTQWSALSDLKREARKGIEDLLSSHDVKLDPEFDVPRSLFTACVKTFIEKDNETLQANQQSLKSLLEEFGGFPLLDLHWNEQKFNFENTQILWHQRIKMTVLFVHLDVDQERKHILIAPMTAKDMEHSFLNSKINANDFQVQLSKLSKHLGSNLDSKDIETDADSLNDFIKLLLKAVSHQGAEYSDSMTIDALKGRFTGVLWTTVLSHVANVSENLLNNWTVVVSNPEILREISDILDSTMYRTVANFVGLRLLESIGLLADVEINALLRPGSDIENATNETKRGMCLELVESYFEPTIRRLHLQRYFGPLHNETCKSIQTQADALLTHFESITWMSEVTKDGIRERLDRLKKAVVDHDFSSINVTISSKNLIKIYLSVSEAASKSPDFKRNGQVSLLDRLTKSDDVNKVRPNTALSVEMLTPPVYYEESASALNWGALGFLLALRALDGQKLVIKNTIGILDHFRESVDCFEVQCSNLVEPVKSIPVDTKKCHSLLLLDSIALETAIKAFDDIKVMNVCLPLVLKNFTSEQLFFMSLGNLWCNNHGSEYVVNRILSGETYVPESVRLNALLTNNQRFNKAFDCPPELRMNAKKKCQMPVF